MSPSVDIRDSGIEGRGLFARHRIEPGKVVMRLGGEVLTDEAFRDLNLVRYSSMAIDDGLNLLIADDSPTNFGNHSCDSNLWMDDAVTISTRWAIKQDEELTVDYALMTADLVWTMRCHCGSPICRNVVTNDDWHRRDVQDRYAGHFSPFLNRRIAALRGPSWGR